jgi:hypothetical protein
MTRSPPVWSGVIDAPPRTPLPASFLTLAIVALVVLGNVAPWSWSAWLTLGLVAAALVALALRSPFAAHAAVVGVLVYGVRHLPLVGGVFPLNIATTLVLYALVLSSHPRVRASAGWLRGGSLDKQTLLAVVAFAATSAIALVVWRYTTHAHLQRFRASFPDWPGWTIPFALAAGALLNAAFEEVVWRGVVMHALEAAFGRGVLVCGLQAVAFGAWHYYGFPSGVVGSCLATIFAAMMGILRMRGRGMLAPLVAHFVADFTIFVLVAMMVFWG